MSEPGSRMQGWPSATELLELNPSLSGAQQELLRAEYEHLTSSFLANEEAGERRVNVFVAVVAASIAALGLAEGAPHLPVLATITSTVLLVLGLATLRRIAGRNVATTEFLNGLRVIRATYVMENPSLLRSLPFVPDEMPLRREGRGKESQSNRSTRRLQWWKRWGWGKAGLAEVVAFLNSVLSGIAAGGFTGVAGAAAPLDETPLWVPAVAGVAVAAFAWVSQLSWLSSFYDNETAVRHQQRAHSIHWWETHLDAAERFRAGAGVIVMRQDGRVLAFERSDVEGAWQLPQGGLRINEDAEDAAWRELQEETGLTSNHVDLAGSLDCWLGYELPTDAQNAKTGRGQVHRWFLFRLRPDVQLPRLPAGPGEELRDRQWLRLEDLVQKAAPFRQPVYRELVDRMRQSHGFQ